MASPSAPRPTTLTDRLTARVTRDHAFIGVVVAVWALLYVRGFGDVGSLGHLPVRVWDETRYAMPAQLMADGGSWLTPHIRVKTHSNDLGYARRLVKPPLVYWLQATSMELFGVSAFAARVPTALSSLGCAGVVYGIGRHVYDRRAGLAGALFLLTFPGLLLGSHGGRAAVSDTTLALFGSLFVWLTWRGRENPKLLVPAGVFAGLAVMTKGVAAGVFVIILLPVVLRSVRSYLTGWTAAAVASTAAVALPWHLWASLEHGNEFVRAYFVTSVASRVQGQATEPPAEPIFGFMNYPYFRYALELFLPPYPYALPVFGTGIVCALAFVWWRTRRDGVADHWDEVLLVWWLLAVPLTFALGGGNHAWYLLPMYVPGSVLLGLVPAALADGTFGAAVDDALARTPFRSLAARGRRLRGRFPTAAGLRARLGRRGRAAVYPAVVLVLALSLVATYGAPLAEPYNEEQREIGTALAGEVPDGETVYVWLDGNLTTRSLMTLSFYADRPLENVSAERLRTDTRVRYGIVPDGRADELDRAHRVFARGPQNNMTVVVFEDGTGSGALSAHSPGRNVDRTPAFAAGAATLADP